MPLLLTLNNHFLHAADSLRPLALLAARLVIAQVFWASGMVKLEDMDTAIALFELEYRVPLLPPPLAAYLATFFELACPLLLALGLGARMATLPLLAMTAIIQLTYLENQEHLYWATLLCIILTLGAGKLSLDYLIQQKTKKGL